MPSKEGANLCSFRTRFAASEECVASSGPQMRFSSVSNEVSHFYWLRPYPIDGLVTHFRGGRFLRFFLPAGNVNCFLVAPTKSSVKPNARIIWIFSPVHSKSMNVNGFISCRYLT